MHVDAIIAGGELLGYKAEKATANPRSTAAMPAICGVEDRMGYGTEPVANLVPRLASPGTTSTEPVLDQS